MASVVRRLLILGALATIVGCGTGATGALSSRASMTAQSSQIPSAGAETIRVGESVAFSMYTHCGVESTRINGRVWNAVDPLYGSPERLGPPIGWGDPEQIGEMTLESSDRAVFATLGRQVVFMPSETGEPLRPCD